MTAVQKWYRRKDGTTVFKSGRYKVLEIHLRPGKFYCCFVFDRGRVISGNGYHSAALKTLGKAMKWGIRKAKELNII